MALSRVKVNHAGWRVLERRIRGLCEGAHVKMGILAKAGGAEDAGGGRTVADVGRIHEYGAPSAGLPERSFIRAGLAARADAIEALVGQVTGAVIEGKLAPVRALDIIGAYGAGEIKRFIATGQVKPETSPAARAAKNRRAGKADGARTVTLVDHGVLLNSIGHEVVP